MKKDFNVYYGLEIEGCFNADFIKNNLKINEIPSYHNPKHFNSFWRFERDGSLWRSAKFENEVLIEFTTIKLKNRNEFFKAINNFKRNVFKNKPLNEVMDFNKSMGCHIHISTDKKNYFSKLFSIEDYQEIRKKFFELINKSKKLSDDTKEKVKNQYHREHALKLTAYNIKENDKYQEFNKLSEIFDRQGLEWRGFNLNGCKNWLEFKELFNIAYLTLEYLLKRRFSKKKKCERHFYKLNDIKDKIRFIMKDEFIYLDEDSYIIERVFKENNIMIYNDEREENQINFRIDNEGFIY